MVRYNVLALVAKDILEAFVYAVCEPWVFLVDSR